MTEDPTTERPERILADSAEGRFRLTAAEILEKRAAAMVTGAKGVLDVSEPASADRYLLAAGRMVTALDLFESCLPDLDRRSCREEVVRIREAIAARRDIDAVISLCGGVKAEMDSGPARGLERALERLGDRQSDLNRELARQIHGRRLQALTVRVEDLADRARKPVIGTGDATAPVTAELTGTARALVEARLDRLRELAAAALEPEAGEEQHRLRDAAATLRFSLELTAAAIGSRAQTARRAARSLQEALGELRDSDLARPALLEAIATLEAEDVEVIAGRASGSRDLDPVLVLAAPNRAAYQGCRLALVHAQARRRMMAERFRRLWLEQSRQGVWVGLESALRNGSPG